MCLGLEMTQQVRVFTVYWRGPQLSSHSDASQNSSCRHIDVGFDRLVILLFKTALKLRADVPCRYGSKKADV